MAEYKDVYMHNLYTLFTLGNNTLNNLEVGEGEERERVQTKREEVIFETSW